MKSNERRTEIIREASDIFAENGFSGTRTRAIARKCGINEALLYKHFSSKEELYREVLEYQHQKLFTGWQDILDSDDDPYKTLNMLVDKVSQSILESPGFYRSMLHCLSESINEEPIRKMVKEWNDLQHGVVKTAVDRAIKEQNPELSDRSNEITWVIRGMFWLMIVFQVMGQKKQLREAVDSDLHGTVLSWLFEGHDTVQRD